MDCGKLSNADLNRLLAEPLHGEAGNRLNASVGQVGFLARELLAEVPRALASLAD